mgnify:CR=1 FL=1
MAEEEFQLGDVVILKSDSPEMTIDEIDGEYVFVNWFDRKTKDVKGKWLKKTSLKRPPSRGGPGVLARG